MTEAHHHHAHLSPSLVESVAGLSAGIIATLAVHPLDIVKTRMQIHRSSSAAAAPALTTVALIRTLTQTPHPVASLYRGLTPNLLGNATSWTAFFFFKSRVERAIAFWKTGAPETSGSVGSRQGAVKAALSASDFFVASAAAGALTQVLTNPLWVLKTRMLSSDRTATGAYPGLVSGARRLWAAEGWRGFYRGLAISMFGVVHGSVQFAVYEPAKKMYFARRQRRLGDVPEATQLTNEATVIISSFAKLVAGATTYPYQVLRSRLQMYNADEAFGRGIREASKRLWREEGIRGFYRGLVPGVVRVMPATWVTFLVYENVKYYLPRWLD